MVLGIWDFKGGVDFFKECDIMLIYETSYYKKKFIITIIIVTASTGGLFCM